MYHREEFSARLKMAMNNAGVTDSATSLARAFNAFTKGSPVTVYAARKWLLGEAVPTQPKLVDLACLLGVNVMWLRFGTSAETTQLAPSPEFTSEQRIWMHNFNNLNARQRKLVTDLITELKGVNHG